jgi:negative regulator of sigma E activity
VGEVPAETVAQISKAISFKKNATNAMDDK